MSLSSASSSQYTGKVLMGVHTPGPDEMSIQEIEGRNRPIWDESVNQEYLDRVKGKARDMARGIIATALAEAEVIKARAKAKGLEEGAAEAEELVARKMESLGQAMEQTLATIAGQGLTIWNARRDDLLRLTRMAIAKTLEVEISQRRLESLENLLNEALDRIDSQRQMSLRVSTQDEETIQELMKKAQSANPALSNWRVLVDPGLELGGVIVETVEGMVDNSVAGRWAGVESILDQLALETEDPENGSGRQEG